MPETKELPPPKLNVKYTVEVRDNVAKIDEAFALRDEPGADVEDEIVESQEPLTIEYKVEEQPDRRHHVEMPDNIDRRLEAQFNGAVQASEVRHNGGFDLTSVPYDELLLELASRDASSLDAKQMFEETMLLDERFHKAPIKLVGLHQEVSRALASKIYGKG